MKKLRAGTAGLVLAAATITPTAAAAAAPTVPVQGMPINIGMTGSCTLGFNDHEKGVSYTAAHCAAHAGQRVSLVDPRTGRTSRPLGTITPSSKYQSSKIDNDWAVITWDKDVKLGGNPYSGDRLLSLDQVKEGDKVCFHGETTHSGTGNISCGEYFGSVGQSFVTSIRAGHPGDSGGPMWIDGGGFVGVVTAGSAMEGTGTWMFLGGKKVEGKPVLWGTAPRDGEAINPAQMIQLQARAADLEFPVFGPGGFNFIDWLNPGDNIFPEPPSIPESPTIPGPTGPTGTIQPPKSENPVAPTPSGTEQPHTGGNDTDSKKSSASSKKDGVSSEADAMSSEKSTGEIVLIVVSVLAVVLPIVLKLAQTVM